MAIYINPEHEGRLHTATHTKQGSKISLAKEMKAKHSSNPATRKQATFALNARKWNHSGKKS